jgi:hypothetical protein
MQTATCIFDPGAFAGPIHATSTGWDLTLLAAFRNTVTGDKTVLGGIVASVLDADTPAQIAAKIGAAVKAEGIARGFTITACSIPNFSNLAV